MKKAIASVALAGITVLGAGMTQAQDSKPVGSGPNPFSDCGIGAALFPSVDWAAVTSNVIWDVGTTAVTSATMSPETCSGKDMMAAKFILDTYDSLVEETAKGEGDHIASVLNIMECGSAQQSRAVIQIRSGVQGLVSDAGYSSLDATQKAEKMYFIVNSAASTCSA